MSKVSVSYTCADDLGLLVGTVEEVAATLAYRFDQTIEDMELELWTQLALSPINENHLVLTINK